MRACMQTCRHAELQACRHADAEMQACRHEDMQTYAEMQNCRHGRKDHSAASSGGYKQIAVQFIVALLVQVHLHCQSSPTEMQ